MKATAELTTRGTPRKYKVHTPQEKEAALAQVVRSGGIQARALEVLRRNDGIRLAQKTLSFWVNEEKEMLERLRRELAPQINAEMAEMHRALALTTAEIEAEAVGRIKERLEADEGNLKDLSAVQQRAAIGTGVHSDKHLIYSGQPNQITEHRDAGSVLRQLAARGFDFEAEAVDVTSDAD